MSKVIALDIETTGLDPWRDEILMVGLWDGVEYVCCRTKEDFEKYWHVRILRREQRAEIVCHNAQFDIKFLEVKGWWKPDGRTIHDTKIMASLLKRKVPKDFIDQYERDRKALGREKKVKLRKASANSLKVLAPYYLNVPRFWETGDYNDEEYNRKDCQYTYDLFQLFGALLKEEGSLEFYEKMLAWSEMVRAMEIKGIELDEEELNELETIYMFKRQDSLKILEFQWQEHTEYYLELCALAKSKPIEKIPAFNFGSSVQMKWLLKDRLGLDVKDAEGDETTGKSTLNRLANEGREDVKNFLTWRKCNKILTSYLPSYKELAHEGSLHPSFNLTGTRTGRTSSSGPNLQQVPDTLYGLFKPREGCKFIKYDLSGIEAALIALYSGDSRLYEIIFKGESVHDHNAKLLFDLTCPVVEVKQRFPKERACAKTLGFACFYGAGAKRIKNTFQEKGFSVSDKEAKQKLKKLKEHYRRAFEFHKEVTELFAVGDTMTNLFGRPVKIQPWENPYMQGFNTLVQSSASDLNLEACYRYWKQGGNPLLVIHDCILAEEPADLAETRSVLMQECMTNWTLESEHGMIPLRVEGGVSDVWEK